MIGLWTVVVYVPVPGLLGIRAGTGRDERLLTDTVGAAGAGGAGDAGKAGLGHSSRNESTAA